MTTVPVTGLTIARMCVPANEQATSIEEATRCLQTLEPLCVGALAYDLLLEKLTTILVKNEELMSHFQALAAELPVQHLTTGLLH